MYLSICPNVNLYIKTYTHHMYEHIQEHLQIIKNFIIKTVHISILL